MVDLNILYVLKLLYITFAKIINHLVRSMVKVFDICCLGFAHCIKYQLEIQLKNILMINLIIFQCGLKKKIENAENISVTTDAWTDAYTMKSFLGITIHFLNGSTFLSGKD